MTQAEAPALEVQDLRFAYPDGTQALHGISLRVEPGEKVALIGPNGSGKSTFLLNLNGIFRSTGGIVRVLGETLDDRSLGSIRA
ncbi:MAG: ATP-binding cassette domain-containing protein, partial [Dehalococcoidia bacterium]|nr:ATP-binding cassette domain-containing protein [Dehalococcoidia bacterium]